MWMRRTHVKRGMAGVVGGAEGGGIVRVRAEGEDGGGKDDGWGQGGSARGYMRGQKPTESMGTPQRESTRGEGPGIAEGAVHA